LAEWFWYWTARWTLAWI